MSEDNTFRVWVGCLACYNAGDLVGFWIDADEAEDVTSPREAFGAHIRANESGHYPSAHDIEKHEEFWCFDIENAPQGHRGEMSPMEAQRLANVLNAVDEDKRDAFAAYCANTGAEFSEDNVSDFEDHFHGHWDSFRDYADEWADEMLSGVKAQLGIDDDHPLIRHFDWEHHAREMESDYFTEDAPNGGVFVFSN